MSQENVEIRNQAVRAFFAAFEDDDAAFRAVLHPEIEWYPIEEDRTITRGIEAALRNRNEWLDTWEVHRFELEEVVEERNDVVVGVHITTRGRGSGVESDIRFYAQFISQDGKVVYIYDHDDRTTALQAAGLAE